MYMMQTLHAMCVYTLCRCLMITLLHSVGPLHMEEVEVLCCGVVGWKAPPETGGLIEHYVARFFTGETMQDTPENKRELQRFFDFSERHYAVANNIPSNCSTVLYAQVNNHKSRV